MGTASSRVHGASMVAAWVGCSSCGQMIAKHYRPAFPKRKIAGKDFWFAAHWTFMLLTVLLTAISFIVIYVYRGQQSVNAHSILGLITGILTFLQPIAATFRPAPQSSKRFWFNWGHWLAGNLAHAFAIINLFLATNFRTVKEKTGYAWILTVYTVIYILTDYVLQKIPKEAKIEGSPNGIVAEAVQQIEMGNKAAGDEKPKMAQKLAKNATKLTKFILFGYMFVCIFCAFLLVLIVGNVGTFGQTAAASPATNTTG